MSAAPLDALNALVAQRLLAPLASLRGACRFYLALEGSVRLALMLIAAALCQLILDRTLRLSIDQRAVLNVVITVFWLWIVWRHLISPLTRPLDDRFLAAVVDAAHPRLHDQLAAAVQFARGQIGRAENNSPALAAAVVREACERAGDVSFRAVLDHRRARRRGAELAGLVGLVGLVWWWAPELMNTWFARNWLVQEIPWPQRVYIEPQGFDDHGRRRVPRGDDLLIVANIIGEAPDTADLTWSTPGGRRGRERMSLVGRKRFEASLGTLTEDVSFRIAGGDEHTRQFTVEMVERPAIVRSVARITPPPYTGLGAVALEQQTVLDLLQGSTLEIEAQLNKPVRTARFVGAGGPAAEVERVADTQIRVSLPAPTSGSFSFELVDDDGWDDRRPVHFTIKVSPDPPPAVRLEMAGVGELVTPVAELALEIEARDVYGVGSVELVTQRGEAPPQAAPLAGFEPGAREFRHQARLALPSLGVAAGEKLRLWAQAGDTDPAGPHVGKTNPAGLQVVTAEDFLNEMARRELELRREFEQLISQQRGVKEAIDQVLRDLAPGRTPSTVSGQRLASLQRRQESHATRVLALKRKFEQVLAEMRTSRVVRTGDETRLSDRIAEPLGQLARGLMAQAAGGMGDLRREVGASQLEAAPLAQAEILRQMRLILANMLEWEGYREAVALLREIITQQQSVRTATMKAMEAQLDAILGLEEPGSTATQPANP